MIDPMSASPTMDDDTTFDQELQRRRLAALDAFMQFGQRSTFASALVLLTVWLVLARSNWMLMLVPIVLVRSALWTPTRSILRRGQTDAALLVMVYCESALAIMVTIGIPWAMPVMVLSLLGPLVFSATVASRRILFVITCSSVLVSMVIAFLGLWDPLTNANDINELVDEFWIDLGVIISIGLQLAPVVILVGQTNRHERQALDDVLGLNRALSASEAEVTASRRRLVSIADLERSRIERDIHDGAQQRLVALAVRLKLLGHNLDPDVQQKLSLLGNDLDDAIDELRTLARGVYPPLLKAHGLVAALQAAGRQAVLPVTVTGDDTQRHEPEIERAFYFGSLEALQNAAKHGGESTRVTIGLTQTADEARIVVSDDGVGFDAKTVERGNGLTNIVDRMRAVNGQVEFGRSPTRGAVVTMTVPTSIGG